MGEIKYSKTEFENKCDALDKSIDFNAVPIIMDLGSNQSDAINSFVETYNKLANLLRFYEDTLHDTISRMREMGALLEDNDNNMSQTIENSMSIDDN